MTSAKGPEKMKPSWGACNLWLASLLFVAPVQAQYQLLVSLLSDRSAAIPLEGTTLSDDIYVFTSPDAGVQTTNANRVRFWLDDPAQSGSPIHSEKAAPYDFAGGSASSASPFDANSLVDGSHTITAELPLASGATEVIHATFVAVSAANLPPVLDPIGSQSLAEQQTLSVPVSASDPEGQPVALSAASLPPFASFVDNGDGTGSLNLAPSPGDAGTYAPIVSASDGNLIDSETVPITVTPPPNQAPTAALIANPSSGDVPLPVSFDGNTSTDADGTIVSYDWDFGDGQTDTGAIVSHTYAAAGSFTVTLTVTDDDGATDTATTTIAVNDPSNQAPTAALIANPSSGDVPLPVSFDGNTSTDADGTIVSYDWDFGDGQTDTGAIVSHTYDAVGSFTVTDDDGATDTATTTIAVNDPAAAYLLLVSLSSDRSAAIPLEGTTLSDDIYVFTSPDAGVQTTNANRVRFWLDDPAQSGSPIHSEKTAPYDFAGGSASSASPFDANSLVDGSHTITAALPLASGATEVIHATFVAVSAANLPPVLDPIGSQSLAEQQTLSVPVSASDPEGQPVALSAASLPPFASFVDNGDGTGSLNLAPSPGDAGTYAPCCVARPVT